MGKPLEHAGQFEISEIIPLILNKPSRAILNGYSVGVNSVRLRTFANKGCTCIRCGLKASYFQLDYMDTFSDKPHLNLYGISNGKPVLFTKDHIIPASKGGSTTLKNLQTMCEDCNQMKGNKREYFFTPLYYRIKAQLRLLDDFFVRTWFTIITTKIRGYVCMKRKVYNTIEHTCEVCKKRTSLPTEKNNPVILTTIPAMLDEGEEPDLSKHWICENCLNTIREEF